MQDRAKESRRAASPPFDITYYGGKEIGAPSNYIIIFANLLTMVLYMHTI